jgi:hypothetical protein
MRSRRPRPWQGLLPAGALALAAGVVLGAHGCRLTPFAEEQGPGAPPELARGGGPTTVATGTVLPGAAAAQTFAPSTAQSGQAATVSDGRPPEAPPPPAATPTPTQAVAQPGAVVAQPGAAVAQPESVAVQPGTAVAQPGAVVVQPGAAVVQPGAVVAQPGAAVAQPGTAVAQPGAAVTPPEAAGAQPGAVAVQPGTAVAQPGAVVAQPGTAVAQPGATEAQPGTAVAQPGTAVAQPGAAAAQPGAAAAQPGAAGTAPAGAEAAAGTAARAGAPPEGAAATPAPMAPTIVALPQPIRQEPFTVQVAAGPVQVLPPFHRGPQPLIVLLTGAAAGASTPCDTLGAMGRSFGWTVCLPPLPGEGAGETESPAQQLDTALRAIEGRAPGTVLHSNSVIVAVDTTVDEIAALRASTSTHWSCALLVEPSMGPSGALPSPEGLHRVAFIGPTSRTRAAPAQQLAQGIAREGVSTAWFPSSARPLASEPMVRRALAWLLVGEDSGLCPPAEASALPNSSVALCAVPRRSGAS